MNDEGLDERLSSTASLEQYDEKMGRPALQRLVGVDEELRWQGPSVYIEDLKGAQTRQA